MDSSRIFIRGLPPNLTAEEFKQHFSKQTEITDAKFIPHRRIGYVGFRSHEDAAKAVKYHHKTFIRMSRIAVELARSVRDLLKLVQWLKRGTKMIDAKVDDQNSLRQRADANSGTGAIQITSGTSPEKTNLGKRKRDVVGTKDHRDRKLQEFLEVMQPPSKSKTWTNDDVAKISTRVERIPSPSRQVADTRNDGEYNHIPVKPKITRVTKEADLIDDSKSTVIRETQVSSDPLLLATSQVAKEAAQPSTDEAWLRSRTSRLLGLEEAGDPPNQALSDEDEEADRYTSSEKPCQKPSAGQDIITEGTAANGNPTPVSSVDPSNNANSASERLFVRNLSYETTEEDLRSHFEIHGTITEVHIPKDSRTGNSKGFAYIQYNNPEAANSALKALDGRPCQGRLLQIISATAKRQTGLDEFSISKMPLKKQQLLKRRAEATTSTFNWNSLYMNADAVMSSISDRLRISKSELLDPTSSNAAIKQAHAETHIIQETKAYFAANGINMDAFRSTERGDTAILVKNFAYGTQVDELKKLFEPHGNVLRVLMPPAGTIAIIEFEVGEHARSAFRSLAYRKFKDSVLFLEKAPKLLLNGVNSHTNTNETILSTSNRVKLLTTDLLEVETTQQLTLTSTLFVKNVSFITTTERLREVFKPLDGFISAKIKMKPDTKKPGEFLSMGFGFLEFSSEQHAQAALASMDGYKLDGHELLIRASHKAVDAAEQRRKEDEVKKLAGRRTKIIIKNLPFEISKKDIRALFSAYGQLRSVRLPKKFDSSTRGFAFADFVTAREAESAMAALKDTHLLGRRLVLEFAAADMLDPEEEIEKMQNKMGNQANKVTLQKLANLGVRRKFNIEAGEDLQRD